MKVIGSNSDLCIEMEFLWGLFFFFLFLEKWTRVRLIEIERKLNLSVVTVVSLRVSKNIAWLLKLWLICECIYICVYGIVLGED